MSDPLEWVRVVSGGTAHLARLSDPTGAVLCGYHLSHPTEEIDQIALPGQPTTIPNEVCPDCEREAERREEWR